jgi:uncharacterized OsmC-like protein
MVGPYLPETAMSLEALASAVGRVRAVLDRKPSAGLHDDAPATSSWQGGTRCIASHANGTRVETDMPKEVGGTAQAVTPGWLFRAGLASCAVPTYVTQAALEGLELTLLEVRVDSRSDVSGYNGMAEADGTPVDAGPRDLRMHVRIAARGASAETLRDFVARAQCLSPVPQAVLKARPIALEVEVA